MGVALIGTIVALGGCLSVDEFTCSSDQQCAFEGQQGTCDPTSGRCALPDTSCASGRRFAGEDDGQCVPLVDAGDGADTGVADRAAPIDADVDGGVDAGPEEDGGLQDSGPGDQGPDGGAPPVCNITQLVAGGETACVVRNDARAYCWGSNQYSQTGLGIFGGSSNVVYPVIENGTFETMEGIERVALGEAHGCGLKQNGEALCWGGRWQGHLGVPEYIADYTGAYPVQTEPSVFITNATSLSVGYEHSCVARDAEQLWCWGRNDERQLGRTSSAAFSPVPEPVLDDARTVPLSPVAGAGLGARHSCAVASGIAYCWGGNDEGELGDGMNVDRALAAPVVGLPTTVEEIALGWNSTCARLTNQQVWCWGSNAYGQLGTGSFMLTESATPIQVVDGTGAPLTDVSSISSGEEFVCALRIGEVWCWGRNENGELGDGSNMPRPAAAAIVHQNGVALSEVIEFVTGFKFGCALRDGEPQVMCWGSNAWEQLGRYRSELTSISRPVTVDACSDACLENIQQIEAGNRFTCSRLVGGSVHCSGSGNDQHFGNSVYYGETSRAFEIRNLDGSPTVGIEDLRIGSDSTCGRTGTGTLLCWGAPWAGRLGSGSDGSAPAEVLTVSGLSLDDVIDFDIWDDHSCAARQDGTLYCWGGNWTGQLGTGDFSDAQRATPAAIGDVRRVAVSDQHSCAIKNDGTVWCWGSNSNFQLGSETSTAASPSPLQVLDGAGAPFADATEIEVGYEFTCALKNDGTVWCWGISESGELGRPAQGDQAIPARVVDGAGAPLQDVFQISIGNRHGCARTMQGEVRCWGEGEDGQRGDGLVGQRSFATSVIGTSVYTHVSAGVDFTCALTDDGDAECWGKNNWTQLGIGYKTIDQSTVPITPQYVCP